MMRTLYISLCLMVASVVTAQQDLMLTQFAFNKLNYNPAYASQQRFAEVGVAIRDQWNGLEGAPTSQLLSVAVPWREQSMGFGGIISRDAIGITERLDMRLMSSYSIELETSVLSGGLEVSSRRYVQDFTDDRLTPFDPVGLDPAAAGGKVQDYTFNIGVGVYYRTKTMFAGVSMPRILQPRFGPDSQSSEYRQIYALTGVNIQTNTDFVVVPQILLKWAQAAPLDIDVQVGVTYRQEYYGGINFRAGGNNGGFGESLAFLVGLRPVERLFFGISYDITLSRIRLYESGSLEALIKYSFGDNVAKGSIMNPRFF